MYKTALIISLLLIVIGVSGCTMKEGETSTFGEKTISLESIKVLNNTTTDYYEYNGTNYSYIMGTVQNRNRYDAFKVKMKAIAYDEDGEIVATNETVYLEPKNIPASGQSLFYFEFVDQNKKIVKYDVKVVDAKATP